MGKNPPQSVRTVTAADRAALLVAVGGDVEQYLTDLDGAGLTVEMIQRDIRVRSNRTVDLPLERVALLVEVAKDRCVFTTAEHIHEDGVVVSGRLGMPVKEFIAQFPTGTPQGTIVKAVLAALTEPLPFREGRLERLVKVTLHPNAKVGAWPLPTVPGVGATPMFSPVRQPMSTPVKVKQFSGEGTATVGKTRVTAPRKASTVRRRTVPSPGPKKKKSPMRRLEEELDAVLGSSSGAFAIKHAKIAKSKGAVSNRDLFDPTAAMLRARGARTDLTGEDIMTIARAHGWQTDKERERQRQKERQRARHPFSSSNARSEPRGFWGDIRHQTNVRSVGGGLPTLGKRR
ncbi:hypothetical protein [Cellulomonas sp. Leaf395]|uniref:hypothetical protein n=1 Tax=Cellulomonas sp. Leaf395 TaxID=1736362 RepID=UPI000AD3A71C|nr:hypothetical protein [Cellulomonas sp. Leaf395]